MEAAELIWRAAVAEARLRGAPADDLAADLEHWASTNHRRANLERVLGSCGVVER